MIRSARPRLHDIETNIQLVADLIRGRTKSHVQHDVALRYAILHALMIIAEAVRHLPPTMLAPFPAVPWKDIVGIGTIIKHEYHRVDPDVIWSTAKVHLPTLHPLMKKMLVDAEQGADPL